MIRLIFLGLLLAGGVWIGLSLHQQHGMVMLAFGGKSYEVTLFVGSVIAILAFAVLYLIIRLIVGFLNIPEWVKHISARRRERYAVEKTQQGLIKLAGGDWHHAESLLLHGVKGSKFPLLNYLAAARAASELGHDQKRDEYLALAHTLTSDHDLSVGLTQAELLFNQGQFEQSLATLKQIRSIAPKHPVVLKLLKNLYLQLKDWSGLVELMPLLKKHKIVNEEDALALEKRAYKELLLASHGQSVETLWHDIPKGYHTQPELVAIYVKQMMLAHKKEEAEAAIKYCLKKEWDESLILMYGALNPVNPTKALSVTEGWLKVHPESSGLLLTCGRFAAQNELWGKAQRYLEACLAIEPKLEAYAILGLVYEKMEKPALSAECFKKGMLQASVGEHALSGYLLEDKSKESS